MIFTSYYKTPEDFSNIFINSDGEKLIGLWFENSRDSLKHTLLGEKANLEIFKLTKTWLDIYFGGAIPDFLPPYDLGSLSPFRREVCNEMLKIPYGELDTYGAIAKVLAEKKGIKRMSAQAVGGGVGHNPIGIIIPCHRVIGSSGSLTGYGGGMANKVALLKLEGHDMNKFVIPTKGTAI